MRTGECHDNDLLEERNTCEEQPGYSLLVAVHAQTLDLREHIVRVDVLKEGFGLILTRGLNLLGLIFRSHSLMKGRRMKMYGGQRLNERNEMSVRIEIHTTKILLPFSHIHVIKFLLKRMPSAQVTNIQ